MHEAMSWIWVAAVVGPGHRVASGQASDSPYPAGTIALQTPHFLAAGLDLTPFWPGTLNLDLSPVQFRLAQPHRRIDQLVWTEHHPPETFSFCRCRLRWQGSEVAGLVYYPHPETKRTHFQSATTLEVLAPWLPGVKDGVGLEIALQPSEIRLLNPDEKSIRHDHPALQSSNCAADHLSASDLPQA
jgi:hypothetical protein